MSTVPAPDGTNATEHAAMRETIKSLGLVDPDAFDAALKPAAELDLQARAAAIVRQAHEMLDREEHRYVERYIDCPNGCVYEHRNLGPGSRPLQTAGPADCTECEFGSAEDEDAHHLDAFLKDLAAIADVLEQDQPEQPPAAPRRFRDAREAMRSISCDQCGVGAEAYCVGPNNVPTVEHSTRYNAAVLQGVLPL